MKKKKSQRGFAEFKIAKKLLKSILLVVQKLSDKKNIHKTRKEEEIVLKVLLQILLPGSVV